jgi:hypothetical protein
MESSRLSGRSDNAQGVIGDLDRGSMDLKAQRRERCRSFSSYTGARIG